MVKFKLKGFDEEFILPTPDDNKSDTKIDSMPIFGKYVEKEEVYPEIVERFDITKKYVAIRDLDIHLPFGDNKPYTIQRGDILTNCKTVRDKSGVIRYEYTHEKTGYKLNAYYSWFFAEFDSFFKNIYELDDVEGQIAELQIKRNSLKRAMAVFPEEYDEKDEKVDVEK